MKHRYRGFRRKTKSWLKKVRRDLIEYYRTSPHRKEKTTFQTIIGRLSNWQRNQWARAGYPGLQGQDESKLQLFLKKMR